MRWTLYIAIARVQLSIGDSRRWLPWASVGQGRAHWALQGGALRTSFRYDWARR